MCRSDKGCQKWNFKEKSAFCGKPPKIFAGCYRNRRRSIQYRSMIREVGGESKRNRAKGEETRRKMRKGSAKRTKRERKRAKRERKESEKRAKRERKEKERKEKEPE